MLLNEKGFHAIQSWECVVIAVMAEHVLVRLINVTHPGADEEAELSMDALPVADQPLLTPGAIFSWVIGYSLGDHGQRIWSSLIRFRRFPVWTRREIEEAQRAADRLGKLLGWQ